MNKRMKHWPAAIQGASAVADELDEAKRESLGMNMNLFPTQNML